jgi:hypothetical protein
VSRALHFLLRGIHDTDNSTLNPMKGTSLRFGLVCVNLGRE